jgi:catechol 2,3-dioxygenase-like lactoylglutathione lyase family enzyme
MSGAAICGIDHLLVAVRDLDRAAATYRRLGFTLSPRAVHSAHMGTANHTIMLERDYFELLAVLTPTQANARWRAALAEGEGLAGLAAATPSAAAAGAAWREAGLAASEVLAFSRAVERADGTRMEARFEVVTCPSRRCRRCRSSPARSSPATLCGCPSCSITPIRRARSASSPSRRRIRWGRQNPGRARSRARRAPRFPARHYDLAKPERASALAIEFGVRDVDALRAALGRGGLSPELRGDLTSVGSAHAHGVHVAFLPAGSPVS